jgi:O-glycosyl hydrolase
MFLDYDGQGGRVGSKSLDATTSDLEASSVYAMQEGENDLQLVLINKSADVLDAAINLGKAKGFKSAKPYVLTNAGKKPTPAEPVAVSGSKVQYKMPPYSVTTLVFD